MDNRFNEGSPASSARSDSFGAGSTPYGQPSDQGAACTEQYPQLDVISANELLSTVFSRRDFIVRSLIRPGLAVLAGSPKIGKSWMVLDLCVQVALGKSFLGLECKSGEVLYIALEDDRRRIQRRLMTITDGGVDRLYFTTNCHPLGQELEDEIVSFYKRHMSLRLIVIDTFQKIRRSVREMSYANDYREVSRLKKLADGLGICILLVHHTRKQSDGDFMNEISGTNGIAGSADTLMVLKKNTRAGRSAVLSCTGRDIEDREIKLSFDREACIWEVKGDSLSEEGKSLPEEITELAEFMKELGEYGGTNTDFTARFCNARSFIITPNCLKRSMNLYRWELEDLGVVFKSFKSNGSRKLAVVYVPPKPAPAPREETDTDY